MFVWLTLYIYRLRAFKFTKYERMDRSNNITTSESGIRQIRILYFECFKAYRCHFVLNYTGVTRNHQYQSIIDRIHPALCSVNSKYQIFFLN